MTDASHRVPDIAPARATIRQPSWAVGQGGWDTHAHVFGPVDQFPYASERSYTPPEQTVVDYVRMLDTLGLRFGVLVQPSIYGHDNRAMLGAMRRVPGRLVTVVDCDILALSDATLAEYHDAGVRGLRVRWPSVQPSSWLADVAARLREVGWHLDVHARSSAALIDLAPRIGSLGVPVMIEAMGSPKAGEPTDTPGFRTLLDLLRDGAAWVKLSHPYQIDPSGPPYASVVPFARALVATAPGQAVWGSDWPHPMRAGTIPDDGELLDLLPSWTGSAETARRVLIDNPAQFYGMPPS